MSQILSKSRKAQVTQKSRRDEYREQTREALLVAARTVFAEVGFGPASTEVIARNARVTRGAFYHHFEDKSALFDAVVVKLCAEVAEKIARRVRGNDDLWASLLEGISHYLDECTHPDYSVIVIQNAPAVLGEKRYHEIDEQHAAGLLIANIRALESAGEIDCDNPVLLSRMINAMICKAAVLLASRKDTTKLKQDAIHTIERCLESFRTN